MSAFHESSSGDAPTDARDFSVPRSPSTENERHDSEPTSEYSRNSVANDVRDDIRDILNSQQRILARFIEPAIHELESTSPSPRRDAELHVLRARERIARETIQRYANYAKQTEQLLDAPFVAILSKGTDFFFDPAYNNPELLGHAIQEAGGAVELARQIGILAGCGEVIVDIFDSYERSRHVFESLDELQNQTLKQTTGRSGNEMIASGERQPIMRLDSDNFHKRTIDALWYLGVTFPEATNDTRIALQTLLETLSDELRLQIGGLFGADSELDPETYEGLERPANRYHDNVNTPTMLHAIRALGELGGDEIVGYLHDWMRDQSVSFVPTVARTLEAANPERVAQTFLPDLRNPDRFMRLAAHYILNRLEFGNIGVSERGIRYLDKTFDLGIYNNPENMVRRISSRGELGIFVPKDTADETTAVQDYALEKTFSPEDVVAADQETIKANVLDFTVEHLFVVPEHETAADKAEREAVTQEFLQNYYQRSRDPLFVESRTQLQNHTLQEQMAFFRVVRDADDATRASVEQFIRDYDGDGLKCFLATNVPEHRDRVLRLAKQFPSETLQALWEAYGRIADAVGFIIEDLTALLSSQTTTAEQRQAIRSNLLHRAEEMLEKIERIGVAPDERRPLDTRAIQEILADAQYELLLFAATFKTLRQEGREISPEDFENTRVDRISGPEIPEDVKQELLDMTDRNWRDKPALHATVLNGFRQALADSNSRFVIPYHQNKPLGCIRFKTLENGRVYSGSLNIRPAVRGSSIGEAFLKSAIERESQQHIVEATAYPKLPIIHRYIGEFGTVATGVISNYENTGEDFFALELNRAINPHYQYFRRPIEKIQAAYQTNVPDLSRDVNIVRYDMDTEYDAFLESAKRLLSGGAFVMTAFEKDPQHPKAVYAVFEKTIASPQE